LKIEDRLTGDAGTPLDAGARAALEARKPLTYVCPPAAWAVAPVLSALGDAEAEGPRLVALAPDISDVLDLCRTIRPFPGFEPIHSVTGVARAARLLAAGAAKTLVVTVRDALRLAEMSRLRLGGVPTVALLWPEQMIAAGDEELIGTLLAEAADAQRLFFTSDASAVKDLTERHARRAPLVTASKPPEQPTLAARYVVTDSERRLGTIRAVLDTLNPASTLLWEPAVDRYERWSEFVEDPSVSVSETPEPGRAFELAIATELPSLEVLGRLASVAQSVVVLARASQVGYLNRIVRSPKSLHVEQAADRARTKAHQLRESVRHRIEQSDVSAELLALGPLFDEYDPAIVAAALARPTPTGTPTPAAAPVPEEAPMPAWVRIQVGVGKRDRVRPADIVGALLNGVGLAKDHVGKVDIREGYSIVEIRAEDGSRTLRALAGLKVRGKALGARVAN
jgi:ATP-dependent RNA helicase DeaD